MFTQTLTPFQAPRRTLRSRAPTRDDYTPARVVIGPPIGNGRVAFVQHPDMPRPPELLISLIGRRPGEETDALLLCAAIRRCDLWNGDFDARLAALVQWTGWAVTTIERRELPLTSV